MTRERHEFIAGVDGAKCGYKIGLAHDEAYCHQPRSAEVHAVEPLPPFDDPAWDKAAEMRKQQIFGEPATASPAQPLTVEQALAELKKMFPHRWITVTTSAVSAIFINGDTVTHGPTVEVVDQMRSKILGRGKTLAEAMQQVREWKEKQ